MNFRINVAGSIHINRFVDNNLPNEPMQDACVQLLNVGILSDGFYPAAGVITQPGLVCQQSAVSVKPLSKLLLLVLRPFHH